MKVLVNCVSQDWDSELPKKQLVTDSISDVWQSDATAAAPGARIVRPGPPRGRGAGRRRPLSDGQSYYNGGGGSGRLHPTEPRTTRSPYDVGSRQRLSSSEQSPMEVVHVYTQRVYDCKALSSFILACFF